ncbi:hypothetical protein S14_56 [Shewanella sp. phage 1/4]|uniref:hypothetical protein n=1 Tax=Shewanella phage 1/4 TaxID=1458859 RepID=UPI0004F87818|nr:hypothetical protein S14_56 [Shewanella sp. phage 1/4]AHK11168.1 hypothetical protein S14_56 [Shewanella sp. phage 1/4]
MFKEFYMSKPTFHDWRKEGKHLPHFMRDFHDQKDLFKAMTVYFDNSDECPVNWVDGHVYTIDWFLWFMAAHGYTLQKNRSAVEFLDYEMTIRSCMEEWKGSISTGGVK